jgi:hypothetical protein
MPKKKALEVPLPRPYRRAILRMDAALEQNSPRDNSEMIEIFGRQHFGALWDARPREPKQ